MGGGGVARWEVQDGDVGPEQGLGEEGVHVRCGLPEYVAAGAKMNSTKPHNKQHRIHLTTLRK